MLKKYLKAFLSLFIVLFLGILFVTLLEYFNLSSQIVLNIFKIIVLITSLFIPSFILARKSDNKGYQKGLIIGISFNLMVILFSIINGFFGINFKYIIMFFITMIISVLGGILGISKKED